MLTLETYGMIGLYDIKGPYTYYTITLGGGGTVGSDVTLRENWSVFIRCRTMPLGAALAL